MAARPIREQRLDLDAVLHAVRVGVAAQRMPLGEEVRVVRLAVRRASCSTRPPGAAPSRRRTRAAGAACRPSRARGRSRCRAWDRGERPRAARPRRARARGSRRAARAKRGPSGRRAGSAILRSRRCGRRRSMPTTRSRGARVASRSAMRCPMKVRRPVIATVAGALTTHSLPASHDEATPRDPSDTMRLDERHPPRRDRRRPALPRAPFAGRIIPSVPSDSPPSGRAIAERRDRLIALDARPADEENSARSIPPTICAQIAAAARIAPTRLDPDTYVSRASYEVARLAAGATIDAARAVAAGARRRGLRRRAAAGPPRRSGSRDGLLPVQQRRDRGARAAPRRRRAHPDPRLGRPPRQRHAAQLRGGSRRALLLDAPVPVLSGNGRLRRGGPRRRRRARR